MKNKSKNDHRLLEKLKLPRTSPRLPFQMRCQRSIQNYYPVGLIWRCLDPGGLPSAGAEGLSSFPANCTVKLHLKVEQSWVKSQRCLSAMASHMASVNLQKLSKLFKSIPLMLKRSTTWVPIFSLVIFYRFYQSFTIFALKPGWGTNEFSFGIYSTSDDRMDNIIGKPMLQHAIDETGKLRM